MSLKDAFKRGGASFVFPVALLITLLASGYTPTYAAVFGILADLSVGYQRPMGFMDVLDVGAGREKHDHDRRSIVLGRLDRERDCDRGHWQYLLLDDREWSNGSVLIAIGLIAIASLVLGMGLGTAAILYWQHSVHRLWPA